MNIAYFAFSEEFGAPHAGFVHTYNIVKSIYGQGVKVTIFMKKSNYKIENLKIPSIQVTLPTTKNLGRVNPLKYLESYMKIKSIVKNVDIIHDRFHVNPIDLCFLDKKPFILEVNGPEMLIYSGLKGSIISYFMNRRFKRADAIITQTQTLKTILSNFYPRNIYVIPNGVDINLFKPKIESKVRENYGINENEILITFVGAFKEWHGVQDIPIIVKMILKRYNNVKFLLIGEGDLFDDIRRKTEKFKEKVIMAGGQPYSEVPKFLVASDILLAPFNASKFKALEKYGFWWCPIKLFEYMASGKPIVSYDFEEVRNIVRNAGLLAEPNNLDKFIKHLSLLIENGELRRELGERGRKIAKREYTWEERGKEVIKVYKEIIGT